MSCRLAWLVFLQVACVACVPTKPLQADSHALNAVLEFTQADDGGMVRLIRGQQFVVRLPARPGTGFSWIVSRTPPFLTMIENSFTGAVLPGGQQDQILRFQADGQGEGPLALVYARPWEKNSPGEQIFSLQIKIGKS